MLGEHPIGVILLATDLQASKIFYAQKVGLEIVSETDDAVTFQCGGSTRLTVSASTTGTADEQTQASWRVENLVAELAELRSRGVEILEYDTRELKTENGIVDTGMRCMPGSSTRPRIRSASISTSELMGPPDSRLRALRGFMNPAWVRTSHHAVRLRRSASGQRVRNYTA